MGNQTSNEERQYQRMASDPLANRSQQPQYNRVQSAETAKQQQLGVENALNTLQSMFMLVDREVLRLVLMEQCQGNLDNAVESLLTMQSTSQTQQPKPTMVVSSSNNNNNGPKALILAPTQELIYQIDNVLSTLLIYCNDI
eukprot:185588_1